MEYPSESTRKTCHSVFGAVNGYHKAYLTAGKWIVDHSDILLAVHDGRPPNPTKGGTAEAVDYAFCGGHPIRVINPTTRVVRST